MKWMKAVACSALLALSGGVLRRGTNGIAPGLCLWPFTGYLRPFPVVSGDAAACRL